jgi:16S rRNA (guanine966-N2)-methyltransferase
MRIVAGSARGRKLSSPTGVDTRPTSDRVRESVFNMLYSLGDAVADATVVDLFAGSGALGLESLSRGAAHVVFVERDRAALEVIEQNIVATKTDAARITVVRAEVMDWLAAHNDVVDVAFVDPPYAFDAWPALLTALPASLAVLESNRDVIADADDAGPWEVIRRRSFGSTVITMVRRRPAAGVNDAGE